MWIFSGAGFVSIVQDADQPTRLWVRARVAADLGELRRYVPGLSRTTTTPSRDYRYRAFCSREELALGIARLVMEIDYPNFKAAVAARQGWSRERIYADVWSVMANAERKLEDTDDVRHGESEQSSPGESQPMRQPRARPRRSR